MSFASVLNSYCDAIGCTNKELAEKCGLSASTLSRYRNGERVPEIDSNAVDRLVAGIVDLLSERSGDDTWRRVIVRSAFEASLPSAKKPGMGMSYGERVSTVMSMLDIRNSEMSRILGVSPSYMSRIRRDERAPSGNRELAERFARAVVQRSIDLGKGGDLAELIGTGRLAGVGPRFGVDDQQYLIDGVLRWLQGSSIPESSVEALEALFEKIDAYYFEDVLANVGDPESVAAPSECERPEERIVFRSGFSELRKTEFEFID